MSTSSSSSFSSYSSSLSFYISLISVLWLQTARVTVWTFFPILLVHSSVSFYTLNVPLLVSIPLSLSLQFTSLAIRVVSIDPSSAESLPQKHLRLISTLFRKKVLLHAFLQICTLLILTLFAAVLCNLIIHPDLNYITLSIPCLSKISSSSSSSSSLVQTLYQEVINNDRCVNIKGVFMLFISCLVSFVSVIRWHAFGMSRVLYNTPIEWNIISNEEIIEDKQVMSNQVITIQPQQKKFKLPSDVLWVRIQRGFGIAISESIVITIWTLFFSLFLIMSFSSTLQTNDIKGVIRMILDISNSLTKPYKKGSFGVFKDESHTSSS
jgi:hypothetical protein